jgi:Putative adhesin
MSNQEMQFADPDWKPSQQLDTTNNPQEQGVYTPQPVNSDYREQNKWAAAGASAPEQEGYAGLRPYAGPIPGQMQAGNYGSRPYRRRGRGPLFWIILAIIIVSLASGGMHSFNSIGADPGHFNDKPPIIKTYDYIVSPQPTIAINDPNGNVTVTVGTSNTDVTIQTSNRNDFLGNPNDIQSNITQNANNITANVPNSADLQVKVPEGANLSLNTAGGDIIFDGTIGTTGIYNFQTDSGDINLNVPTTPSFLLNASTSSGSINSNTFPNVTVQDNTSGSGQNVNGVVGASTHGQGAKVTITTSGGDINLNQK